jgi:hypothetical protein
MGLLNRDQFLAVDSRKTEVVDVPELGEGAQIKIRSWSVGQANKFAKLLHEAEGQNIALTVLDLRAKVVALSVVDEANALMFTEEDVPALEEMSPAAIDRIQSAAMKLNGFGRTTEEEDEKNA